MSESKSTHTPYDIAIVGGAGHVGLPLSMVFANKGKRVLICDLDRRALSQIAEGRMPFMEHGAEPMLKNLIDRKLITLTDDASTLRDADSIVITIGTPIDEFLNPTLRVIRNCIDELLPCLSDGQLIVLRSTVYPGVTKWVGRYLESRGKRILLSYCPERIVQGNAIEELQSLSQIVSGTTPEAEEAAARLFGVIAPDIVRLSPTEAEFAKLFSNAYRYIQFAATNQFYMIATAAGVDYHRVLEGMKKNYPRLSDLPGAGFTAGPCLLKDTMQLAAFSDNSFTLGHSAMLINEALPLFIVDNILKGYALEEMTVGLLGMAFKSESDDPRASLSYKLKKVLDFRAKRVLTTDPYVARDVELLPLEEVIAESDILIVCVPHRAYKHLDLKGKTIVDVWNFIEPKVADIE
jgi:UDP-N-acetyl-D-mannosaminuronic acid dehydrogenase